MERVLVEDNSIASSNPPAAANQAVASTQETGRTLVEDNSFSPAVESNEVRDDSVSLGDMVQDTLHIAGSDNADGTRDFFGGSDANERFGQGIATAYNGEGGLMGPTKSVAQGIGDTVLGTGAGVNDMIASTINYFDDENAAADFFSRGASLLRGKMANPGGAADAVGSEIGGMVASVPAGSVAGKAVGKLMKPAATSIYRSAAALFGDKGAKSSKALRGIYKIGDDIAAGRRVDTNPSIPGHKIPKDFDISAEIIKRGVKGAPDTIQPPIISVAGLTKYFDKLVGKNTPYSRELAQQAEALITQGYSPEDALLQVLNTYGKAASKYTNRGTKLANNGSKLGGATGALFGSQSD